MIIQEVLVGSRCRWALDGFSSPPPSALMVIDVGYFKPATKNDGRPVVSPARPASPPASHIVLYSSARVAEFQHSFWGPFLHSYNICRISHLLVATYVITMINSTM